MAADSDDIGEADPDAVPTADIEVEATVHFGMAGAFPTRVAELFVISRGCTSPSTPTSRRCGGSEPANTAGTPADGRGGVHR